LPGATGELPADRFGYQKSFKIQKSDPLMAACEALNVGSRVPIATGSFQAGVGVGTTVGETRW